MSDYSPDLKAAFDDAYDALEELLDMNEANPKWHEDSERWQYIIGVSHSVLDYWKKLRKES